MPSDGRCATQAFSGNFCVSLSSATDRSAPYRLDLGYDDLIGQSSTHRVLEEMARRLFDEWFWEVLGRDHTF
jgi:hypothetical protein